jgi:putative MATE family efflux protein
MGRQDRAHAELVFNQSLALASMTGLFYFLVMFALRDPYSAWLAADATTADQSARYLTWFVPAMALQFPLVALGSALRATGDMKVPTVIQIVTVVVNIVLAPLLIFGTGPVPPLGVAGAAIASLVAIAGGGAVLARYFQRPASPMRIHLTSWRPRFDLWRSMLAIGVPAGGEFLLLGVYATIVYAIIQPFGVAAQAGFGLGVRVMQSLFLPAVAIGFATAAVAGQNFGAARGDRVRGTFASACLLTSAVMLVPTVVCQVAPAWLVGAFSSDAAAVHFGAEYLSVISWTFVLSGILFAASSVFQGLGNTLPPLASSTLRVLLFTINAQFVVRAANFQMRYIWWLSVATVVFQSVLTLWLLRREFARRLPARA